VSAAVKRVAVLGPGRIGRQIALAFALGGSHVSLVDLKDRSAAEAAAVFADVVANLRAIQKAKLVHADMSEYNLLWWGGQVVVIDVGQAVTLDHPRAAEWFKRDVGNVARFFRRLRIDVTPASLERAILGG